MNTTKPTTSSESISYQPIGYIISDQNEPYQASRQPDDLSSPAILRLNPGFNFEQALTDLSGCTHIWVIYHFHKNDHWKPMVQTPRSNSKIGVFATRAPYRPNGIGLSVAKLDKIEGLDLYLGANDLLNNTPILDIKPYHPEADIVSDAKISWLDEDLGPKMVITFSPRALDQIDFLENQSGSKADAEKNHLLLLKPFILRQLEYDPLNNKKKRVSPVESQSGYYTLAYRTWRVDFLIQDTTVAVISLRSGYSEDDLKEFTDPYFDKKIHRLFNSEFF